MAFPDSTPVLPSTTTKLKRPSSPPQHLQPPLAAAASPKRVKRSGETWARLDFILSIQARDLDLERKIELAFNFVKSVSSEANDGPNPVSIHRLASFLSDWIQSILIHPDSSKKSSDFRCWSILQFCLWNSVSISPNLLRAVARLSQHGQDDCTALFDHAFNCLSLLLSTNPRAFSNAPAELWVSCGVEMLSIAHWLLVSNEDFDKELLRLPFLVLEQFNSFLRFNTNPKKVFPVFVDGVFEALLELLVLLHSRVDDGKSGRVGCLLATVEDVLLNGLFHRVHISGFFSLGGSSAKQGAREMKGINESYHRHLFKKLNKIIAEKKARPVCGFGYLFGLFVSKMKAREGATASHKGLSGGNAEQSQETSKPLFDVFMLFMEPLLLECRRLVKVEATELRIEEVNCILSSINKMISSFIEGKIYVRMEDTTEGVHLSFLKEVYGTIISLANKMYVFWTSRLVTSDQEDKKILPMIGREVVVMVGYFLEIEYKVLGEDIVQVWLLLISYLAVYLSYEEDNRLPLLPSEILKLACRLIHVYSELRQVGYPIFALCRAVRLFGISGGGGTIGSEIVSVKLVSCETCLKSVRILVSSQEFRLSISEAIKSIPEGQASGCIQQLSVDVTDSLEWIRGGSSEADGNILDETNSRKAGMLHLDMQAELLGRILSEIYAILLDSVTATASNSVLINNSIRILKQNISPSFSNLVGNQSGNIEGFFSSVTGIEASTCITETALFAMSWIFVFFFRMYTSCRSLYQKSVRLMPSSSSRKASVAMGNLFTVSCGMNRIEKPASMDEGYFSWIAKPSISLSNVIKLLSDDFLSRSFAGYTHLVYVIHVMALERLTDLNRQIKAIEFSEEWDARQVQIQSSDCAGKEKSSGKLKVLVTLSRKEAEELIKFMIGYLQLLPADGQQDVATETKEMLSANKDTWDFGVCSLDEASLPTALWCLLCENTDIWCVHAGTKNLKKFLSHLLHQLLSGVGTFKDLRNQSMSGPFCQKISMHHSTNILRDICEQTVLYKHFGSRFCRIMKQSLSPILSESCAVKIDLSSLPDWSAMLGIFEKVPRFNKRGMKQTERPSLPSIIVDFKACENLLSFLCKMLGVLVDHDSLTLYTTYVVNLERILVSNLLSHNAESSVHNPYDLLSLLKSCRRVMKCMVMASVEGSSGAKTSFFFAAVFNSSSSVLWLLKSVSEIVGRSCAFSSGQNPCLLKEITFPLIGHTSCIFFTISKFAMSCLLSQNSDSSEQDILVNAHKHSASSVYFDACNYVDLVADALKNSLQGIKLETCMTSLNWNNLSYIISCFQGFMWGLASGLDAIYKDCSLETANKMGLVCFSKLNDCIVIFEDFERRCLNMLLIDDVQETDILSTAHEFQGLNSIVGNLSEFSKVDLSKMENLKRTFVQGLLKGESPHIAFTFRELFMASAAILSLKCLLFSFEDMQADTVQVPLPSSSTGILLGTSHLVLLEMSELVGRPDPFCFVWLDGMLKYIEVLGSKFSSADPKLSRDTYALLIDIHLRAIGKCMSLQGKAAVPSSYEIGLNTKMLPSQNGSGDSGMLHEQNYSLDAFKARLRMSLRKLIRRPGKFYLKVVIRALERALVGMQQNLSTAYEINFGNSNGGNISPTVASGIDCLNLLLESVSGQTHVVEKNIPSLIDAIFNIVLHLQSPQIFFLEKLSNDKSELNLDSGSIIIMCIEVLTKVAGRKVAEKHSFDMHPYQITSVCMYQWHFSKIFISLEFLVLHNVLLPHFLITRKQDQGIIVHYPEAHRSKVEGCIALLEDSVSTLLSCLETVNTDLVGQKGYFAWELEDAIKCAGFLRRIYEEIRQQKDVFGRFSYYFLSTYISIYSGCGPSKTSIKREVDEALRPGVYSLIDICTDDDLQLLHTMLGEGPCRSTLATLLNDYRLNFQYEGKV